MVSSAEQVARAGMNVAYLFWESIHNNQDASILPHFWQSHNEIQRKKDFPTVAPGLVEARVDLQDEISQSCPAGR